MEIIKVNLAFKKERLTKKKISYLDKRINESKEK